MNLSEGIMTQGQESKPDRLKIEKTDAGRKSVERLVESHGDLFVDPERESKRQGWVESIVGTPEEEKVKTPVPFSEALWAIRVIRRVQDEKSVDITTNEGSEQLSFGKEKRLVISDKKFDLVRNLVRERSGLGRDEVEGMTNAEIVFLAQRVLEHNGVIEPKEEDLREAKKSYPSIEAWTAAGVKEAREGESLTVEKIGEYLKFIPEDGRILFRDEVKNIEVRELLGEKYAILGSSETNPNLLDQDTLTHIIEQSGAGKKLDFPKGWEGLSVSKKREWLKENGLEVLPAISGGAEEGAEEGTERGVAIVERAAYDYDARVRLVLAKLINFTRVGMENGTEFRSDEYYIGLRGELQSYLDRLNLSVEEGHFKDISDFAEIVSELEYMAKNSVRHSELDPIEEQAVLDDVLNPSLREDIKGIMDDMDERFEAIFKRMDPKTREIIFKTWSLDLEPQIQGVKAGWNRPSHVWEAYFGGRIRELTRDDDGNEVETWRYTDSVMSKVSRDIEESMGGKGMIGLTEWRLLKELQGANEQVLADLLKKPPAQWQEIPERVANIYREIERAELTVETLQGYIGEAINMIKSIPGETEEGLEMIKVKSTELEAFRAFHTLRITQERTGMDPAKAEDIYKSQFTDETWKYFWGRYARDVRGRNFLTEGVSENLADPLFKIYMEKAQGERRDMTLVGYLTVVDIKNRISGDGDSRLREIENFVNRPKDLSARGGKLSLNGRAGRMEELRVQLLSEGAISDVMVIMAKLEELKIRHKDSKLSDDDFKKLERALDRANKSHLFASKPWEKDRIEYFRSKADDEITAEIRKVISDRDSFDDLEELKRMNESWQKEAVRKAYDAAYNWGNAKKTKEVTDLWYRERTLLGAAKDDEYGRDLVRMRRQEMKDALKDALKGGAEKTGLKIEGDDRTTEEIINELEQSGYLEGLDSTMYQFFWMYVMPDFDMIRIYGKHFKTGKVSLYPQAVTFNEASKNVNGRMIHHMMDFLVDEERGRSYEEEEINGITRHFLPGFHDNLLPQNRSMVRFHRHFMDEEQEAKVEERAIDLLKEYRLLPGLEWERRLNAEADAGTRTEYKRDPYFDGMLGWARSAVIAEMIDSGDFTQVDFTKKSVTELMSSKMSQYVMIDLSDDQRATANYYAKQNFQEWLKNPTMENFLRINNGAETFYSGRNLRIWAWTMIATNIQWEIMHKHYKKLKLASENLSASIGESMVENLVASGAMGKDQGELIKNDHFGLKPEFLRGVPGAQILGKKAFRYTRQIEEFMAAGLWETFKPWSGFYPKELWNLLRRIFSYTFGEFNGK